MVKKLIINMECDKDRMSKYKNASRLPAVVGKNAPEEFKKRFVFRYNTAEKKALGHIGCFGSHIKVLRKIINENLKNVIVLEDDSSDINKIPKSLIDFPHSVYLGGWMVKPKIKDINQPVDRSKFINGINKLDYSKYRILETRGYFVPNKQEAKRMLDIIESAPRLKNVDIFFSKNEIIKYFYYPALSLQTPKLVSRINENNVYGKKNDPKSFY
jgi:GR25 family glycosyltransferase involved in LPS biosynthesis